MQQMQRHQAVIVQTLANIRWPPRRNLRRFRRGLQPVVVRQRSRAMWMCAALFPGTIYPGSGTINLSASEDMPAGKWVVINAPNATVRITSSLHYTSAALTSVQSIPQLIIIAQNIVIQDNVDTVDAWLLAKGTGANGTLTTCDASITEPTQLTASVCSTKLTINGPVIANHVNLYRTAGSGTGTASGDPAEVFNLRPDAYMWASNFSGLESKARTVYQTELPPRF